MAKIIAKSTQPAYRWFILFITTFSQTTIAFVAQGVAALAPFFEQGLHLTKSQIGFTGGAINVGMGLTAFLAGRCVDLWGEKRILVIGGMLTGLGIMFASTASAFVSLILWLFFTGLWASSCTPAGSKAVMAWFPYSQRGFALGIRQTGVPLGGLLSALSLPVIAALFSWKIALLAMGLVSWLGSVICLVTLKKDSAAASGQPEGAKTSTLRNILQNRNIWLVSFTAMTYVAAQFTLTTYLILYLHETAGKSIATASLFLALAQLSGAVGRIFWGFVSDTIFHGSRKPVLAGIGILATIMSLAMLTIDSATPLWLIGMEIVFFGFTAIGWNGVFVTFLSEIAGRDQAGTAVGAGLTVIQLGVLGFPPLFGLFLDKSGSYSRGWVALSVLLCFGVLLISRVKEQKST